MRDGTEEKGFVGATGPAGMSPSRGNNSEGKIAPGAGMALPPQIEEPPIAERDVIGRVYAQPGGGAVDPLREPSSSA